MTKFYNKSPFFCEYLTYIKILFITSFSYYIFVSYMLYVVCKIIYLIDLKIKACKNSSNNLL